MSPDLIQTCLAADAKTDSDIALSWQTERLTRAGLRRAIWTRAALLLSKDVQPDERVVICLPKGPAAIEFLLACLSIGAVAVPVDVRNPQLRLMAIITTINPAVIVASPAVFLSLGELPETCLALPVEHPDLSAPAGEQGASYAPGAEDDPAMILMSSGTTGIPKGICISHRNLTAFVTWAVDSFALSSSDRFVSVAPLHFDLSLFDILASQFVGASLHILDESQATFPAQIVKILSEQKITVLYTVPTVLQLMLRRNNIQLNDLRWVLFAGEVMPNSALPDLVAMAPQAGFANLYGPTETNVVSCHILDPDQYEGTDEPLPIGRACGHSEITIRDANGQAVTTGLEGEICVKGPTVTPGYWALPDMTEAARLNGECDTYRTGDIGRFNTDGNLHFLGRMDQKVKVQGNLVDLSEIEHVAMQTSLLENAAAVLIAPGTLHGRVVLHVVPKDSSRFEPGGLAKELAKKLTKYSLPFRIDVHPDLPRTMNGKVNKQAIHNTDLASVQFHNEKESR